MSPSAGFAPAEVSSGIAIHRDLSCVMRDGIELRADVYRPVDEARLPTLVCRTPYGKHDAWLTCVATALAARRYCVVLQDHRGRYASDGEYRWMFADRESTGDHLDGYDTAEWAARLPWSTGAVGAFGHSNDAWSVFTMLSAQPPSVQAAVASGISPNARDFTFGMFETGRRLQWIYEMAADARRARDGSDGPTTREAATFAWQNVERGKYLWWLPLATIPDSVFGGLSEQYKTLLRTYHREFMHLGDIHPKVRVPVLLLTGWWDRLVNAIDHYTGLVASGPVEVADKHRLIVGPWGHEPSRLSRRLGPVDHGPAADADYATILGDWFDLHMKAAEGLEPGREPPIRLFILGADSWRSEEAWPLPGIVPTPAYLSSRGAANTARGDGMMHIGKPPRDAGAPSDTFTYDPRDPAMSLMDADCQVAPMDQTPRNHRQDVLVYETQPFKHDLTLVGPVELILWAASDALDTDWMATLAVVHADGLAVNLSYGVCRSRYRRGFDIAIPLTPGEPEQYRIPLTPLGCLISSGERLRLYVSSSDFPMFDRNHNTGRDDMTDAELRISKQTVLHTTSMASRLVLPVIPNRV